MSKAPGTSTDDIDHPGSTGGRENDRPAGWWRRLRRSIAGPRDAPRRRRWLRLVRFAGATVFLLAVLLVAARLALPSYLRTYVNRVLSQSPEYDGHVGDIHMHLWRGAYEINDVEIVKRTHTVPIPFFSDRRIEFSLDSRSLWKGRVRGSILMQEPRLNFVKGPSPEETQTGADQPWLGILDDLFPFRIDRAAVANGEVHFHTFHTTPKVDVYLSSVDASLTNLTNVQETLEPLMAKVHCEGTAMDSGTFELDISLDPHSHLPSFNLAGRLLNVDVRELNTLSLAYGDFDFEAGKFDFVVEAAAQHGFLSGYAKPLFRDVQVLSLRDFQKDDPIQLLWEAVVGVVGAVFKNQSRDQFGTSITFEGDLDNPQLSILEVLGNVLRNAFIRAYLPTLDGRVAPDVAQPSINQPSLSPTK